MVNQRFGRWVVIGNAVYDSSAKATYYKCECACGEVRDVIEASLITGRSKSCGCDKSRLRAISDATFNAWLHLVALEPSLVHKSWRNSFLTFAKDMGQVPRVNSELVRVDKLSSYEPGNCVWATSSTPISKCAMLRHKGELLPLRVWAKLLGISASKIRARLRKGQGVTDA